MSLEYCELEQRAKKHNITTFGALVDALGIDPQDAFYGEWDESMRTSGLYWCGATEELLHDLASVGII